MKTTVAQRKRAKGWRKPEGSVCVDRTSRWGNPFPVQRVAGGRWAVIFPGSSRTIRFTTLLEARTCAVDLFDWWVAASTDGQARWIRSHVHELAGKTLLCWCPQPGPCHAHVLAELADAALDDA